VPDEKLYTIPESEMVECLMKEIDLWEAEERAAGRLQNGAPTFKTDTRKAEPHEELVDGRVGLPLLQ
jgi:hypothetical protein